MAQPRNPRDPARTLGNAIGSGVGVNGGSRDPYFNDQDSRTPTIGSATFMNPHQPNPMSMLYQRSMAAQVPMMVGAMPMMGMNPMMMGMAGMNMNSPFNPMGGMNMMGMNTMGGMNAMAAAAAAAMGGGVGMRMGMGPMGLTPGVMGGTMPAAASMGGMNPMGMRMRQGMGVGAGAGIGMGAGVGAGGGMGRAAAAGPGPARFTNRGQHNFHPYAR